MEEEDESTSPDDPCMFITDMREYDVPYLTRVCIDLNIRVGCWYEVSSENNLIHLHRQEHILTPSNPKVFAFDIETSKAPLKFPDASKDAIYMISIMIDGRGILLINREIVSKDIDDFEYAFEYTFTLGLRPIQTTRDLFMCTMNLLKRRCFAVFTLLSVYVLLLYLHAISKKSLLFLSLLMEIFSIGRSFAIVLKCTTFRSKTSSVCMK